MHSCLQWHRQHLNIGDISRKTWNSEGRTSALSFWTTVRIVKLAFKSELISGSVAFIPDAPFPTQLKQAILAIQHLIKMGVRPEHLQILGDSAGGTLIHETLSHFLHPVAGVPELSLSTPLGGVYMMSPSVRLVDKHRQYLYSNDNQGDMLTGNLIHRWGSEILRDVPKEAIPYVEANSAPPMWLNGVDRCVKRVLISAGGVECLRDEIIRYQDRFREHHKDVTFILQANGVHNDPHLDFMTHEKDLGELTPQILDWLDENCAKRNWRF